MERKIEKYLEFYKNFILETAEEFGLEIDNKKLKSTIEKRKQLVYNCFENGVDVSRGLLPEVLKPFDIVERNEKFYFSFKVKNKVMLYNINDLY